MTVMHFSCIFLRIFRHYSIQRLQLCFINDFIAIIRFISFTTSNFIYSCIFVLDVVELKFCSKWEGKESGFCLFLRRCRRSEK